MFSGAHCHACLFGLIKPGLQLSGLQINCLVNNILYNIFFSVFLFLFCFGLVFNCFGISGNIKAKYSRM